MPANVQMQPKPLPRSLKTAVLGLEAMKYRLLDGLPGWIADPWDDRLAKLIVGLQSICSDWDLDAMKGLDCSKSIWMRHAALAHGMTLLLKPQVVVDLGVFSGCSSIAMGLALKRLGRGVVYAVDTWEGDDHVGKYDRRVYHRFLEEVHLLDLQDHIIPLKMLFSEAQEHIHGPVDLLHVDGLHTYRAARSDFHLFRNRLSPGAPVLFHDVANRGYPGMLALWHTLAWRYRAYRMKHASGLGIILARGGDRNFGLPSQFRTPIELYEALHQRIFNLQARPLPANNGAHLSPV